MMDFLYALLFFGSRSEEKKARAKGKGMKVQILTLLNV